MGKIVSVIPKDLAALKIIHFPDPRLSKPASDVTEFDDALARLVERMFELMYAARGVGLAAPQVGLPLRLFVSSPTVTDDDRHVYLNPRVLSQDGQQEEEEGCLSLPGITTTLKRFNRVTIEAQDLAGRKFQESGEELIARIFQHEMDHLDGRLIVDRMGTVARLAYRRALKELQEDFEAEK
ncbi:MAG: peptide deformylase [Phycisphaerae bacterium]|jgi:peptide deformylase